MKPDEFEQRLARTPMGEPPADWRAKILEAARAEMPVSRPAPGRRMTVWRSWWRPFRSRLLPMAPSPWAALAGAAAVVAALAGAGSGLESKASAAAGPASAVTTRTAVVAAARHYRAEVIEWVNHDRDPDGEANAAATVAPASNGDRPRSGLEADPEGMPRWHGSARLPA